MAFLFSPLLSSAPDTRRLRRRGISSGYGYGYVDGYGVPSRRVASRALIGDDRRRRRRSLVLRLHTSTCRRRRPPSLFPLLTSRLKAEAEAEGTTRRRKSERPDPNQKRTRKRKRESDTTRLRTVMYCAV